MIVQEVKKENKLDLLEAFDRLNTNKSNLYTTDTQKMIGLSYIVSLKNIKSNPDWCAYRTAWNNKSEESTVIWYSPKEDVYQKVYRLSTPEKRLLTIDPVRFTKEDCHAEDWIVELINM